MAEPLQEISSQPIFGTWGSDFIHIIGTSMHQPDIDYYWNKTVIAKEGDDFIFFEPAVDWNPLNHDFGPAPLSFNGNGGIDAMSVATSGWSVEVNLGTGAGTVHIPNYTSWNGNDWEVIPRSIPLQLNSIENFIGGLEDDRIAGSNGDNLLIGGAGDDTLEGRGGNDNLQGGPGADELWGEDEDDKLFGGDDADRLEGGSGNDTLKGDAGNDTLNGATGNDVLEGGEGDDLLHGWSGLDTAVYDTAGDVTVNLMSGSASGALGNDTLQSIERVETGSGNDEVTGDNGANWFWLGAGNDTASGNSGADRIKGGTGNDTLSGGHGNDSLYGEDGDDDLNGGYGNDLLRGGDANDELIGSVGDDNLDGGDGEDSLYGGTGEDTLDGGAGNDLLAGGDGNDVIITGGGVDTLFWYRGDKGVDTVWGFNSWADALTFEKGIFEGLSDAKQSLAGVQMGADTLMFIERNDGGWEAFALLKESFAHVVNERVSNGDIFGASLESRPGGADEWDFPTNGGLEVMEDAFVF